MDLDLKFMTQRIPVFFKLKLQETLLNQFPFYIWVSIEHLAIGAFSIARAVHAAICVGRRPTLPPNNHVSRAGMHPRHLRTTRATPEAEAVAPLAAAAGAAATKARLGGPNWSS